MDEVSNLSKARTILLAVSLAVESDISGLRCLTAVHPRDLPLQLMLRILLTFLPESTEPSLYTSFIEEVFSGSLRRQENITVNLAPVEDLSEAEARKRIRKLHLLPLQDTGTSLVTSDDALTQFLINRAHRIEAETGLLPLLAQLLVPFLDHSGYLRAWLISTIVPLLRLEYEYYPSDRRTLLLDAFERLETPLGISTLLSKIDHGDTRRGSDVDTVGRDMRGLIGPWMYGDTRRKRRKLDDGRLQTPTSIQSKEPATEGITEHDDEERDLGWSFAWTWFLEKAARDFGLVVRAIEQWDGPLDVDLGGYDDGHEQLDEKVKVRLQGQYAQMALSSIYVTEEDSMDVLEGAHRILIRIADLMHSEPPANLSTELSSLPSLDRSHFVAEDLSVSSLSATALLRPRNSITTPNSETLSLLSSIVLSAYIIQNLGHKVSARRVAELFLSGNGELQTRELHKVLRSVSTTTKRDHKDWLHLRRSFVWLRDWEVENAAAEKATSDQAQGNGVFGKVARDFLERELLKAFLAGTRKSPSEISTTQHSHFPEKQKASRSSWDCLRVTNEILNLTTYLLEYQLAVEIYIKPPTSQRPLAWEHVERVVVDSAMISYDNASNGNRFRGGIKRASDM